MDVKELLETVKEDKNITDDSLDKPLTNYLTQAAEMVCLFVGEDDLPDALKVIVVRMAESHYVQTMTDADGVKSYSEEGASWTFQDNELDPFIPLLERYLQNQSSGGSKGCVWSW